MLICRIAILVFAGLLDDGAEVFELHRAGRTRVIAQSRKLDDANAVFAEVLTGHVPARFVFEF